MNNDEDSALIEYLEAGKNVTKIRCEGCGQLLATISLNVQPFKSCCEDCWNGTGQKLRQDYSCSFHVIHVADKEWLELKAATGSDMMHFTALEYARPNFMLVLGNLRIVVVKGEGTPP